MNIEHVARIGFAPWRLAGEQRDLAMCRGVLGHVVDDDQRVLPAIAKIFRHREAGEGRNPLQAGSGRRACDDEDATLGRAVSLNRVDDPLNRGRFLADCDIDTNNVAALLIDDAIDGDCRLADGAIADDQLALAAPQGKHGIDDEQAGLDGFADEITIEIAGAGRSTGS